MTAVLDPAKRDLATQWNGWQLLDALTAAANLIISHQQQLNALNVYPFPDGDTGTNMSLTMRAAIDEANKLSPAAQSDPRQVASAIEHGALLGARGNSGVILSQMFRGFARSLPVQPLIDGEALVVALAGCRDAAYAAVMEPVEGTMLTVIRVAAESAARVAAGDRSLSTILANALDGARIALADTPNLLDKLREAGVVDAGGQGVVYLLEGLDRTARGELVPTFGSGDPDDVAGSMQFLDRIADIHEEDAFGYCTNFMIFGQDIPFDRLRAELAAMGQSAVIVGDESRVKVHIHTDNPGQLLSHAIQFGELGQIKIDNMNSQLESLIERRAAAATLVLPPPPATCGAVGVIAVASGDGVAAALRSMGACRIVEGGQTMNPSVEDLLAAVESAPATEIIVLPNNPNIVLAAERVAGLTTKRSVVVPTRSIAQGLAALEVYNDERGMSVIVEDMTEAISSVRSIEVTHADRDATMDGVSVSRGQFVGILDDRMVAAGDDAVAVAISTLEIASGAAAELITIFIGEGGAPAIEDPIASSIEAAFPDAEVQVYDGGQPHYRYIVAVE